MTGIEDMLQHQQHLQGDRIEQLALAVAQQEKQLAELRGAIRRITQGENSGI